MEHELFDVDSAFDNALEALDGLVGEECESVAEAGWPHIWRVITKGRTRERRPIFKVVGKRLGPRKSRSAAFSGPGIFVQGNPSHVRQFVQGARITLTGPPDSPHNGGLRHYHAYSPQGRRIHIWFAQKKPKGDFFVH
ncbi:MAG: hypothetical protein MRJ65_11910 [Candidatus Brocadiaceae bacterium]|nr:hypothetical protein [Candidatus Brocadiaceae bacterium]